MGKRRNLKRRDNEAEGAGSGSDVTLSAVENEHDSADESDRGAREEVVTRRENVDFEPPNARRELEREGVEPDQANGVETDNDELGEGDATRPQVRGDNEVTTAMKEMTNALVQTIRESNRAINRNINNLLEEVQRRQPAERIAPAERTGNFVESGHRHRPSTRRLSYSRYDYSDSEDDEHVMYQPRPQPVIGDSVLQREITKLPIFTGKEPWNVWFNRFTEVADRRRWSNEDRLDELLPRLQGTAGEFVFGHLRRDVRSNYAQLVSELNSRFRVVVTKKTYGAQFSHRNQKANESVEEYAAELKRLYDKAHANRDEHTRQEDLLRRFLDGLYDNKARFQVEYVKEPRDIDEAVFQVVDFQETRHRPLLNEGNCEKRGKKHARSVNYVMTEYEDSDLEIEGGDSRNKRVKHKKSSIARKAGSSLSLPTGKTVPGKSAEKQDQSQRVDTDSEGKMEKTLKTLQEKIEGLERQLQQRVSGNMRSTGRSELVCYLCSEKGHISRTCPLRQQGNRGNQTYEQQGNGNQGGYQRRQSSYTRPQNGQYNQTFQGVRPNSSQPLNY